MMGHSIGFASFHIIEVMSSSDFFSKRIGYLAAAQSFSPTTDVLLLTTNQFKKDMTSVKMQDCSQALTCLAKLVTEELGRDLESDVSLLLNSPRPYIRKKALLVLYRLIMVHPDTLPVVSARFKERLTDKDPSVICAAVTVTCELARASPRSFLSLAPVLYQLLMSKDSSNWMLIKIVKLMGVLTPLEPRLGKKLVEPLTTLMRSTRAKSLLYECCCTVTLGLLSYPEAVELCAQRLGEFMNDRDQNLKYLGLLSMRKLIQEHPQVALEHRDNIIDCLDDEDIGIRMRALELVSEFITKRTLRDVSRILLRKLRKSCSDEFAIGEGVESGSNSSADDLEKLSMSSARGQEAPYRRSLAKELLKAGEFRRSSDPEKRGYEMLSTGDDFAWYVNVILGGLAEIPMLPPDIRDTVGEQLLEITSRVEAIRPVCVKVALALLEMRTGRADGAELAKALEEGHTEHAEPGMESGAEIEELESKGATNLSKKASTFSSKPVLSASLAGRAAWIAGEYAELIEDYAEACRIVTEFPKKYLDAAAQVRILTASIKIFVACSDDVVDDLRRVVMNYTKSLLSSQFAEVQERACLFKALLAEVNGSARNVLAPLFEGKLIPVDYRAQSKVPVSPGLDLDTPLLDTGKDSLYTYLLKTIGSPDDEVEVGDDDSELFKEFAFGSATLSISDNPMGIQTGATSSAQSTLLNNLPGAHDKTDSPFYLGSSTPSGKQKLENKATGSGHENESRFKYETGKVSTAAAVVISEENPLGLDLSDEERTHKMSAAGTARYDAAFEGAFDQPQKATASKMEKRKKKKKKKKKTEVVSESNTKSNGGVAQAKDDQPSLIDFDSDPINPESSSTTAPRAPVNLTESLI